MSSQITEAFVKSFSAALYQLSQQKTSKLRPICRTETFTGEQMFVERIGAADGYWLNERHADTKLVNTPHSSRRVDIRPARWADLIDNPDKVRTLIDPTNPYIQTGVMALNRIMDDVITQAIFGIAYDKSGTAVTSYDTGECTIIKADETVVTGSAMSASSTPTGMSVSKILLAKHILDKADIDPDRQRYIICSSDAMNQMLNTDKLTSYEFNELKALVNGSINTFAGFKFIQVNRLNKLGATTYGGKYNSDGSASSNSEIHWAAVAEGAVVLGLGEDIQAKVSERDDKNYATQVYASMDIGAVRIEGPAVVLGLHKAV